MMLVAMQTVRPEGAEGTTPAGTMLSVGRLMACVFDAITDML